MLAHRPSRLFNPVAILLSLTLTTMATASNAYDEPEYLLVESTGDFEVREYAPMLVAEVIVHGSYKDAGNRAFRKLFDYISGNNQSQQEISMTIPVNQQKIESERIEMTTPVTQTQESEGKYRISFVMPSRFNESSIPLPTNPEIQIRSNPARTMAVKKFSGSWSEKNFQKNETMLWQMIQDNNWEILAEPVYARYNSPFSLWFLRRNEIMIEVRI